MPKDKHLEKIYVLPLEKQREELEKIYRDRIEELKKRARMEKARYGISASEIEEARYILFILGESWEPLEDIEAEGQIEEAIEERAERRNNIIDDFKDKNSSKVDFEISANISAIYNIWKESGGNKEKAQAIIEEKIKNEKNEEKKREYEKLKNCYKDLEGLENFNTIRSLERDIERLKEKRDNLSIQKVKNLKLTERERYILEQAGRLDLAYGDNPGRLMQRVREAHNRGEDISRWRPEVWKNKYAVIAMSYPQVLSIPSKFGMEAAWNVRETIMRNPEIFSPGIDWRPEWGKKLVEKEKTFDRAPTWANIPGLINKILVAGLEVDPVRHIESVYKNARLEDRDNLAKIMEACIAKKMKSSDMLGIDGGCVEMRISKKYEAIYKFDEGGNLVNKNTKEEYIYNPEKNCFINKKTGGVLNKTLEQIVDTNCAFWLVIRHAKPIHVGSPYTEESLFHMGKPEIVEGFIALRNYFVREKTRERINKLDEYVNRIEKTPQDEERLLNQISEFKAKLTEAQIKDYEQDIDLILSKVYPIETYNNWGFERRFLEAEILKTKLSHQEAVKKLLKDKVIENLGEENKAVEKLKTILGADQKYRSALEAYFLLKKPPLDKIFGFEIRRARFGDLLLAFYGERRKMGIKNINDKNKIIQFINKSEAYGS